MNGCAIVNHVYIISKFLFNFLLIRNAMMNIFVYNAYFLASKKLFWIHFPKENFCIKEYYKYMLTKELCDFVKVAELSKGSIPFKMWGDTLLIHA